VNPKGSCGPRWLGRLCVPKADRVARADLGLSLFLDAVAAVRAPPVTSLGETGHVALTPRLEASASPNSDQKPWQGTSAICKRQRLYPRA